MALKSASDRLASAKLSMDAFSESLRGHIVETVAALVPAGFFVQWTQSDQVYDDSQFHFDLEDIYLSTEREPRRVREISPEVPEIYETVQGPGFYGQSWRRVTQYHRPAVWDLELDPVGALRGPLPANCRGDGVYSSYELVDDYEEYVPPSLGLDREAVMALLAVVEDLRDDEKMTRAAFGDRAVVTIWHDGKVEVT